MKKLARFVYLIKNYSMLDLWYGFHKRHPLVTPIIVSIIMAIITILILKEAF